ncbi:MAG TPA: hypothetical protein PLB18_04235 [Acidobacteriota bacterium]|nr:hypothetical protein [Acidobacteriota bacterium]HNC46630.1 hypothetical protein [Acidobacteriota bacterium]HND18556.1 hypothetical protein [Acidobacteriota bacterium]HNJ41757.1 hypothetical protein [Acidobacteriota bacterium]
MSHPHLALSLARQTIELIDQWPWKPVSQEWERKKIEKMQPLLHKALARLDHPAEAGSAVIVCRISVVTSKADEYEEWFERSRVWEVICAADSVQCQSHSNLATMVGASQSDWFVVCATDRETPEMLKQAEVWRSKLAQAIVQPEVYVDVVERKP